ncbi:3-oxoacyl-ACP synthase III family protein [Pedobacter alpinus]|uniref:3-oxoacyl-ACP synthase III family protein n=1 Tax=Pedobacter alpinus TaxID=1590643 RepID=A0ABW5TQM6_9SPHI
MANFSTHSVAISGVAACVPKKQERNRDLANLSSEDIDKFIATTGVEARRIVDDHICTSDLCLAAAEKLIHDLDWDKKEIEILVFVSQTGDYTLPVTSTILQDRLGLSQECIAFDVPLGCSGYVYGLSIISGMMAATRLKKGILLVGDTISKINSENDKSTTPLFGDAGSATCLTYDDHAEPIHFNLGSDGSGYQSIMVESGGFRNQTSKDSFEPKVIADGIERNQLQLSLDGMDVFSFGISQAPKTIKALVESFSINLTSVDFFFFHQANLMMNKMIVKKLKLNPEKIPYSLKEFGNTSSASIPLTIVNHIGREKSISYTGDLILCGFGVGLSWGTCFVKLNNTFISELLEI